jgi:hypothetical protein
VVEIRDMGLKYHIIGSTCHLVFNKVNTTQRAVFHVNNTVKVKINQWGKISDREQVLVL